jgi:hypothetical protein
MVPDGVAAIWTADLPLRRGIEWNDWLAAEIKRQIGPLEECWLSVALSHPHPSDYDIERFTRVRPFPIDEWDTRLERPTVTFIWREDRIWQNVSQYGRFQRLMQTLERRLGLAQHLLHEQKQQVVALAQALWRAFPPDRITDMRSLEINEYVEKAWCERYAKSHVVIGVHGSNMLLPSAHAGAVVELVPVERWGNLIQDILVAGQDTRETMYRYKSLPLNTSLTVVAKVTKSLLRYFPSAMLNFNRRWCDHGVIQGDSGLIAKRRREIARRLLD